MSITHSFNHHPDAIASIQRASMMPPAPWTRVYIAASMMEVIATRTKETGEYVRALGALDLEGTKEIIDKATAKAGTGSLWTEPQEARGTLGRLESAFAAIRFKLALSNKPDALYGIAGSIAETGAAYISAVTGAPDSPGAKKTSFMASSYRASPLVAMDTAAVLAFHAAGFLEESGQPLQGLPTPYNLAQSYLKNIHKHRFRAMDMHQCFQDRMLMCVNSLKALSGNTAQLLGQKAVRGLVEDRLDIHTLLATTQYLADSFSPPSKNQRAEHEKTLRPSATVLEFKPRG